MEDVNMVELKKFMENQIIVRVCHSLIQETDMPAETLMEAQDVVSSGVENNLTPIFNMEVFPLP